MAKKLKRTGRDAPEKATRYKALLRATVLAATVGAAGAGAFYGWRWYTLPARAQAGVPGVPVSSRINDHLAARLEEAMARLHDRNTALEAAEELGRLYQANGFLREAGQCWEFLAREEPRNARWIYLLAHVRESLGDQAASLDLYRQAHDIAPDYAPAILRIADIDLKSGRAGAAAAGYRDVLALQPEDLYARLGLARIAIDRGDHDEAYRLLQEIIDRDDKFPPAHNLLAELLAADGDERRAREHRWLGRESGRFRQAPDPWVDELEDWCLDPARLQTLGTMAYQLGDHERGIALLKRAIDLAPTDPYSYALLGDVYHKLSDQQAAINTLEAGLRAADGIKPVAMHYVTLSQAYRAIGRPETALSIAEDGIEALGPSYELLDARGVALGELGRDEEAIESFQAALRDKPNDTNANFNLANAYLSLGRTEEGIAHLKQALVANPTFPRALYLLSRFELERGDLDAAEAYIRPLYDANSGQQKARDLMMTLLYRRGKQAEEANNLKEAERFYREGLAIAPEAPELNAGLGVLLLVNGRVQESVPFLEAYYRLRPANPTAALLLGQAYAQVGRFPDARRVLQTGLAAAEKAGNQQTASHCREILAALPR